MLPSAYLDDAEAGNNFLIDYFSSRFASGSKDGTARIWTFRQGEWHSSQLIMRAEDGRRVYFNTSKQAEEPLR
jgi:hypothetical protein